MMSEPRRIRFVPGEGVSAKARDALGARMKSDYEFRARTMLPRRTWTIVRIDGKAFHAYTRGLDRPFDRQFIDDMVTTTVHLCEQVQGCRLGYCQSDEISLVLADNQGPASEAWFDGNQQKIVSVTASMATAKFNQLRPGRLAYFDSRAFTIPDVHEVANYLVWRQQDAVRNSISMAAQAQFSHRELHGVTAGQMQEKLFTERGINWNDYDPWCKRGAFVVQRTRSEQVTYTDKRTQEEHAVDALRSRWEPVGVTPTFTAEREHVLATLTGVEWPAEAVAASLGAAGR